MSYGLLFPGQGSQHPAMLPWLDDGCEPTPPLRLLQAALGTDWRQRSSEARWATRNDVAQTLLTGSSLAAWARLQPLLPPPGAIAGYSVGELAAFCAAGVFDAGVALQLARQRAALMDDCVRDVDTGLLSVSAATPELIDTLCRRFGLAVAIRIGVGRCIVGGLRAALIAAESTAVESGASCTMLAVPLASHTPWMLQGVASFADVLEAVQFGAPRAPLVCNRVGHALQRPAELRHALSSQVASPVLWDRCMDTVAERGVRCVLEVGPGTVLSRMWKLRFPEIPARAVEEFQQPSGAADWVHECMHQG
jgi:[acyl-carrier-protein] S-malonyltransferase